MSEYIHPVTEKINQKQIQESNQARVEALKWLGKTFPEAFNTEHRVRPLKKGIMEDILSYMEQNNLQKVYSKSKVREAVVMFTHRMEYLVCLKCRNDRIDLQGKFSEPVSVEESEFAAKKIKSHLQNAISKSNSDEASFSNYKKEKASALPKSYQKYVGASSVNSGATSSASDNIVTNKTQVTIKRKISKRIDPEAVARLKAKLGIKQERA